MNPVAVGKCRGREQTYRSGDYAVDHGAGADSVVGDTSLCFQIHGDAAFTGQVCIVIYI